MRAPYKVCHFGPRDIGASGFRGFTVVSIYSLVRTLLPKKGPVFTVLVGLSFLKRVPECTCTSYHLFTALAPWLRRCRMAHAVAA